MTVKLADLERQLQSISNAPCDAGPVEMIVSRHGEGEREVLTEAWLDVAHGLEGDTWETRIPKGKTAPDPETQLTVMNARAIAAIAGTRERWPLAGDQLYVELDISVANMPAGTRLGVGGATIEISRLPHTGCKAFVERYGLDALRFVSTPMGRELRLRGANCRVVSSGLVRVGDTVGKLPAHGDASDGTTDRQATNTNDTNELTL